MGFHVAVVWSDGKPSIANMTHERLDLAFKDAKECLTIDPEATVTITGGMPGGY
jgi:hypothetical protein